MRVAAPNPNTGLQPLQHSHQLRQRRAGGKDIFGNSNEMPKPDLANAFGVKNLGVGRPEWTMDWYAPYQPGEQADPVGAVAGYTKVVRGGGLDFRKSATKTTPDLNLPATAPYFSRAANRAGMAPAYASKDGNIGFRVVQSEERRVGKE